MSGTPISWIPKRTVLASVYSREAYTSPFDTLRVNDHPRSTPAATRGRTLHRLNVWGP